MSARTEDQTTPLTRAEKQVLRVIRASRGDDELAPWAAALLPGLIARGLVEMVPALTQEGEEAADAS